jgi:hypothetical protein
VTLSRANPADSGGRIPISRILLFVGATVSFIAILSACAPTAQHSTAYLDHAVGRMRQNEAYAKFGPPLMQVPADHGATIWIYRYAGVRAASPTAIEELWCYEHALTFGADKVLQGWNRQDCQQSHPVP